MKSNLLMASYPLGFASRSDFSVQLTMIDPEASVSALVFHHPD